MKINKKHIEFLKEYEKLCKKYNMSLYGCGCCESPCLIDWNGNKWDYVEKLDNIRFNKNGELTIEPFMGSEEKLEDFINRIEKEDRKKEFQKVKQLIRENYDDADCGLYDTRNIVGDYMATIFKGKYFTLDICYNYSYFEVFGTTSEEFAILKTIYNKLEKEVIKNERRR